MNTETGIAAGVERLRTSFTPTIVLILAFVLAIGTTEGYGQSIEVHDGSNAIGLSGHIDLDSDMTFRSGGGKSAYSIAGVMDIGVSMSNAFEDIEDVVGTVQTLSLHYSVFPVKQQAGIPVSLQLGLSYGLSFLDSRLVLAELERDLDRFGEALSETIDARRYDGSRTGYTLNAVASTDAPLNGRLKLRLAVGGEYRVARTSYTAFLTSGADGDDNEVVLIGDRRQGVYFGPGIGLVYRWPRGLITSWNNRLLFDASFGFQYRPEVSLAILQQ